MADQVRTRLTKLAALMDEAEENALAYMTFPKVHRAKIHSTNPIERANGEIKRRTEVVGMFPNEESVRRLVAVVLLERNDDWVLQHRHLTLETMAGAAPGDNTAVTVLPPAKAARPTTTMTISQFPPP